MSHFYYLCEILGIGSTIKRYVSKKFRGDTMYRYVWVSVDWQWCVMIGIDRCPHLSISKLICIDMFRGKWIHIDASWYVSMFINVYRYVPMGISKPRYVARTMHGICMPYVWIMDKACAWMMRRDLCFPWSVRELDLDSQWIMQHLCMDYATLQHR